jgi:hypothetical protein
MQVTEETQAIVDDAEQLITEATRLHEDWLFLIKVQQQWTLTQIHGIFD